MAMSILLNVVVNVTNMITNEVSRGYVNNGDQIIWVKPCALQFLMGILIFFNYAKV